MKKLLISSMILLGTALSVEASNKGAWTEEEIKNALVQNNNYQGLDLFEELKTQAISLKEIASILGLKEKENKKLVPSTSNTSRISNEHLNSSPVTWDEETIIKVAQIKGNIEEALLRLGNQDLSTDFNEIALMLGFTNKDFREENSPRSVNNSNSIDRDSELAQQLYLLENKNNSSRNYVGHNQDYMIAQKLQKKLNEENNNTSGDYHFAQRLQQEEDRNNKTPSFHNSQIEDNSFRIPTIRIKKEILDTVERANEDSKSYDNSDVHVYNRNIVTRYKSLYSQLQQALGLETDIRVETIMPTLRNYHSGNLSQAIIKMNSYQLNVQDHETGLRIDQILSSIMSLCAKIRGLPHVNINPYPYVIESLNENIDTQGGCKPGYAGRFFRDILYLSSIYLQNVKTVYQD